MPLRTSKHTKGSAQKSTTTTIDHTLYPHIFDLILSAASRPLLLSLRRTPRSVCEAVDRRLAYHIIIEAPVYAAEYGPDSPLGGTRRPLLIYTPSGRLPSFHRFWNSCASFFVYDTADGRELETTTSPAHARIVTALKGTQVADLYAIDDYTASYLRPILPAVRTLRTLPTVGRSSSLCLSVPTVVTWHSLVDRRHGGYTGPAVPRPGVRKLVIHFDVSLSTWRGMALPPDHLPSSLTDMVLIFHHFDKPRRQRLVTPHQPPMPGFLGQMAQKMSYITWLAVAPRYTFVDLHTVDPAALGFTESKVDREEMETRLRESFRRPEENSRNPMMDPEMYDFDREREDRVRFLSSAEYAREVGSAWEEESDRPKTRRHRANLEGEGWSVEWMAD